MNNALKKLFNVTGYTTVELWLNEDQGGKFNFKGMSKLFNSRADIVKAMREHVKANPEWLELNIKQPSNVSKQIHYGFRSDAGDLVMILATQPTNYTAVRKGGWSRAARCFYVPHGETRAIEHFSKRISEESTKEKIAQQRTAKREAKDERLNNWAKVRCSVPADLTDMSGVSLQGVLAYSLRNVIESCSDFFPMAQLVAKNSRSRVEPNRLGRHGIHTRDMTDGLAQELYSSTIAMLQQVGGAAKLKTEIINERFVKFSNEKTSVTAEVGMGRFVGGRTYMYIDCQ